MNGTIILIAVLGAAGAVLAGVIALQRGRNRRLKTELGRETRLKRRAEKTAGKLVELQDTQQEIRVEAEKETGEIDETDDAGLVDLANDLFP